MGEATGPWAARALRVGVQPSWPCREALGCEAGDPVIAAVSPSAPIDPIAVTGPSPVADMTSRSVGPRAPSAGRQSVCLAPATHALCSQRLVPPTQQRLTLSVRTSSCTIHRGLQAHFALSYRRSKLARTRLCHIQLSHAPVGYHCVFESLQFTRVTGGGPRPDRECCCHV